MSNAYVRAQELLAAGARTDIRNKDDLTAHDLAEIQQVLSLVDALDALGSRAHPPPAALYLQSRYSRLLLLRRLRRLAAPGRDGHDVVCRCRACWHHSQRREATEGRTVPTCTLLLIPVSSHLISSHLITSRLVEPDLIWSNHPCGVRDASGALQHEDVLHVLSQATAKSPKVFNKIETPSCNSVCVCLRARALSLTTASSRAGCHLRRMFLC